MSDFKWKDFLSEILSQQYILIVGSEVMLDRNEYDGDSTKYYENEFIKAISNGKCKHANRSKFIIEHPIDEKLFSPELHKLLKEKIFRVVITTCVDNLLERIMSEIWGEELQVLNFYDENKYDLPNLTLNEFNEIKPTLYYAFGKAENGGTFVVEEDDRLNTVSNWLNHARDRYPELLYKYLQQKKIIALGCKFEDWLFRFFWYSLRQNVRTITDNSSNISERNIKELGKIAIELTENDNSLKEYLQEKGWLYEKDNNNNHEQQHGAHDFITDFLSQIEPTPDNETIREMMALNSLGGCFISYANEDFLFAYSLYSALLKRGVKVWIDNEKLYPGADYKTRISQAIKDCIVFLPILSSTTKKDYENGEFSKDENRRYYLQEWDMAMESISSITIIPVTKDGFELGCEAYRNTPWYKKNNKEYDRTVFYSEKESLNKLIKSLTELNAKG